MRKHLLLLSLLLPLTLVAGNKYVTTAGDDDANGNTWATAYATISTAINNCQAGDTVFVAEGTYNQNFGVSDGVCVMGGYQAATGARNIDIFPTIIDGNGLNTWLVVKYDGGCTTPTTIDGFTFQNNEHAHEGGCAYLRTNITMSNCVIRNCSGTNGGGIMMDGAGTISNCLIELCSASSSGGAIRNKGGIVENCIIRGCQGKYGTIRNDGGTVRNCVLYNNEATVSGWPNSGGIYNPGGTVVNCIIANNKGEGYAGIHSDKEVYNCIFWGNAKPEGFNDPENYISAGSHNAADHSFGSATNGMTLSTNNMDANGPQFVAPTAFAGLPTTTAEIAAMRAADFRLAPQSPCIDAGLATQAPANDILGVTRPKGTGVDMGAYEYDPNAAAVAVTGVQFAADTLRITEDGSAIASVIVSPADATDKSVTWQSLNTDIATVDNGSVTGVAIGTARIVVTTTDGGYKDTLVVVVSAKPIVIIHAEVLAADTLYPQAGYTVPSFTPFLVAKEAARKDSSADNLAAMRTAITELKDYRLPYSINANINGDPTTRMAFCWFTNGGVTDGEVQLVEGAGADEAAFANATTLTAIPTNATLRYAVSTSGLLKTPGIDGKTAYNYVSHKALAENLKPATTYSYRVGQTGYWSEVREFVTAANNTDEFSFLVMSDSHIQDQEYVDEAHKCAVAAAANVPEASFLLFPGDFVETGTTANSEWEWEQWFEAMNPVLSKIAVAPTDGNHDDSNNLNYTRHFNTDNQFNQAAKVKPQFDGITYSFVYGDALFMVYSHQDYWRGSYSYANGTSSYLTNDVAPWFRDQVAAHPECKWRIAVVHKNLFCGSGHQSDDDGALFRATLLPVFKELEIDFAIQGHDHTYEVIGPVDPDTKTVVAGAVSEVETVEVNTSTNMTGKKGGKFCVDNGTLYYVGATCGRKRYYPYTRAEMEKDEATHKVTNYFDLFTGRFGQPGAPTYSKVTINSDSILVEAYTAGNAGEATLFDTYRIVRTQEHNNYTALPEVVSSNNVSKFFRNGELIIMRDGVEYTVLGQKK